MQTSLALRLVSGESRSRATGRNWQNRRRVEHAVTAKVRRLRDRLYALTHLGEGVEEVPEGGSVDDGVSHGPSDIKGVPALRYLDGGGRLAVAGIAEGVVESEELLKAKMKHILFFGSTLLMVLTLGESLRPHHFAYRAKGIMNEDQTQIRHQDQGIKEEELEMELYPTGSSLPDCSHACGPCFPCERVMVSFKCFNNVAESCPIIYRCRCKGKYYHVPSN
ncbi:hypothetical protein RJ640_006710 [Escallonia rubra]|uniref:Epidermal patterning factor-like protein n=1 Tax=Escallonia rubra TaxID=112253 RepID=A0AA88RAX6_9ASTE|nr:hypothetical protein RJ640_006710 [Escallonia rubra]